MAVHGATLLGTYLGSECHFQLSGFWVTPVLMPAAWATRPCPAMPITQRRHEPSSWSDHTATPIVKHSHAHCHAAKSTDWPHMWSRPWQI